MKFRKENLPILIQLKRFGPIVEGMSPLVVSMARAFSNTKTPSYVLDQEDYVQVALMAVIEAANAMHPMGENDLESYWAKFIALCRTKIQSRLIETQKRHYLPVKVSQSIARMHPKIHEMMETNADLTIEDVMERFEVSEGIAKELMHIARAEFDNLHISSSDDETCTATIDIGVESNVQSNIFVEEVLGMLDEDERELVESVILEGQSVRNYASCNHLDYSKTLTKFHNVKAKLKEILADSR